MATIELSDQEWGQVMSILSDAPWKLANPLLMKIGEQLRQNHAHMVAEANRQAPANGKEAHDGQ
jgi:hypothetical protein